MKKIKHKFLIEAFDLDGNKLDKVLISNDNCAEIVAGLEPYYAPTAVRKASEAAKAARRCELLAELLSL